MSLGGPKPRALLAVLLLHANEVVATDRLIDELWGEDSPEDAAAALRVNVSRLRKTLPQDVLTTRSPGYVIRVEPDTLDLHRFERLADEGRSLLARGLAADAAKRLHEALSLWRGPALADFAYESFALAAIARLEEIRLAAIELRIDADLALGRHDELVGELEALVSEHPLRERLRRYLMTALYRSGRQAEALDAYQDARRALVDGLGIEPGAELQKLEQAILRHDPSLDLHEPARASGRETAGAVDPRRDRGRDSCRRRCSAWPSHWRSTRRASWSSPGSCRTHRSSRPRRRGSKRTGQGSERGASSPERRRSRRASPARTWPASPPSSTSISSSRRLPRSSFSRELPTTSSPHSSRRLPATSHWSSPAARRQRAPCSSRSAAASTTGRPSSSERGSRRRTACRSGWSVRPPCRSRGSATRAACSRTVLSPSSASWASLPSRCWPTPGEDGMLEASRDAGLVVVGLSSRWHLEGLGTARLRLARDATTPVLLVRRGLRPGGLAPPTALTRFTWSIRSS